jgi:predicted transglutaminase-like cysteine proteinase
MAFVRFCMRTPQDCNVHGKWFQPELLLLTKKRREELEKVNHDVNLAIRPRANHNGVVAEEWLLAPREGDCNDYAVTKRHNLLSLGWPSRSLLLAEVVIPSGEHHLVLVVRTQQDDLVLDNLDNSVHTVAQVPYEWVRAQQAKNPNYWSNVKVKRAMRLAMNAG